MQVLDRIAELGETMYKLEHRDNSGFFPAKTCRDLQLCHSVYNLEDGNKYPLSNNLDYYTTQAVRGPIAKTNQSKCSIAGPIFSKYWTGHCPE